MNKITKIKNKEGNKKNMKKQKSIIYLFFIFLILFLSFVFYEIIRMGLIKNKFFQIFFGLFLLIFNVYFFILPENFIVGGLESNLLFLDKVFFYRKKKQKYFFSKNNNIILIRILIILIFGFLMKDVEYFFILTIITNLLFALMIKILEYFKIHRNFILEKFPFFLKKNVLLKFSFLSVILGINIGLSCGLILSNNASTGGTDVIFSFLKKYFHLQNFKIILLMTDGIMIICSFCLDFKRKIDSKKNIFLKYFFSFIVFFIAIFLIDIVNKWNISINKY
jgi:uncharacterized membrane-anchored protein YitT (DUF2179 family)